MKRLAFLSCTIATLMAPIQVQAQQYDPAGNCVRFPQQPNPEAETRYLLSHPNIRVCPSNPDPEGQRRALEAGGVERAITHARLRCSINGRRCCSTGQTFLRETPLRRRLGQPTSVDPLLTAPGR